jgi:hypothetical protein
MVGIPPPQNKEIQRDYVNVLILEITFILNSFITTNPSYCLATPKNSQLYTAYLI